MKRLTIREIYAAMEEKYPYYQTAGSTWKVRLHSYLFGNTKNFISLSSWLSNQFDIIYRLTDYSNDNRDQ